LQYRYFGKVAGANGVGTLEAITMARDADSTEPRPFDLADLAALADGTLDPLRRDEAQARIESSEQLTELYERERRVVEALHQMRATDRAPAGLRQKLDAARRDAARPRTRWRLNMPGTVVGVACAAVIVLALVLLLPGGTPGSPAISQAAALATRGATAPAPPAAAGGRLKMDVQEVYFPDWSAQGWRAVGQRTDRIDGRVAQTVYYEWHGHRAAYTIVSAPALKQPAASGVFTVNRTVLRTLRLGGRYVVTWRRANHTCVLSVAGVPAPQLASDLRQLAAS
jgi:anti-sigma factor RsiW